MSESVIDRVERATPWESVSAIYGSLGNRGPYIDIEHACQQFADFSNGLIPDEAFCDTLHAGATYRSKWIFQHGYAEVGAQLTNPPRYQRKCHYISVVRCGLGPRNRGPVIYGVSLVKPHSCGAVTTLTLADGWIKTITTESPRWVRASPRSDDNWLIRERDRVLIMGGRLPDVGGDRQR